MQVDERFTREGSNGVRFQAGIATWDTGDGSSLSVRRFVPNQLGRIDPHSSSEVPVEALGEMVDLIRDFLQNR